MNATLLHFLIVLAVVFAVNLLPAFGPPNALLVVFFALNWHLPLIPLVVIAAVASGAGRYLLATATHRVGDHLDTRRRANLRTAGEYLTHRRGRTFAVLGVFLVSPLPSAQMFEAAGLMGLRLLPLTAAHVVGRTVSFTIYVGATGVAERSLGNTLVSSLTSPSGIAIQIALLAAIVMLARIDWAAFLPGAHLAGQSPVRAGTQRAGILSLCKRRAPSKFAALPDHTPETDRSAPPVVGQSDSAN